jgi:hypothetical protein
MNVQKVAYWKIYPSQAIFDNHWGRRAMEDLGQELGIGDLGTALFTSLSAAQEVAQLLLMKWDEEWPWDACQRQAGLEARTTYQGYHNSSNSVSLIRGGEVRTRRVVKTLKTVTVEGEEYTREVEEVHLGEWVKKPDYEQIHRVETWSHLQSVVS